MKKRRLSFDVLSVFASALIAFAPYIAMKQNCTILWGEPECPECLKSPSQG